jgi:predicted enzyme related to lactoylglutathione lyase
MNPVVHFEMPYEDQKRAIDFYSKAFGWESKLTGEKYGNYVVVATQEMDADMMPKKPGMINGGLFEKTKDNQVQSIVISVEDIREAMKKVEEAGGKILGGMRPGEPDEIPNVGLYCSFIDSEGNRVGMLQPVAMK